MQYVLTQIMVLTVAVLMVIKEMVTLDVHQVKNKLLNFLQKCKIIFLIYVKLIITVTAIGLMCQYNEDCPPDKLCDRLNRICKNPCQEDSCGVGADCYPVHHGIECKCPEGAVGNPYIECRAGIYYYFIYTSYNRNLQQII